MSTLLDEILADLREKRIEYEEYLQHIAELANKVQLGHADDLPKRIDTPGKRALYNNNHQNEELAIKIDEAVKHVRYDDWRGNKARENVIKQALWPLLNNDVSEVETGIPHHQTAKGILMKEIIDLGGITAEVTKKNIKNIHLSVNPPEGKVRISAPLRTNTDTIRVFAITRLDWIRQQQRRFRGTRARDTEGVSRSGEPLCFGQAILVEGG